MGREKLEVMLFYFMWVPSILDIASIPFYLYTVVFRRSMSIHALRDSFFQASLQHFGGHERVSKRASSFRAAAVQKNRHPSYLGLRELRKVAKLKASRFAEGLPGLTIFFLQMIR